MAWYWWAGIALYVLIGVSVFWINITSMPVTPALALVRGALWPLAWLGLIPTEQLPMD